MKKNLIFSLLLSFITVIAVAQESGRYRKDADHLEFTLVVDGVVYFYLPKIDEPFLTSRFI